MQNANGHLNQRDAIAVVENARPPEDPIELMQNTDELQSPSLAQRLKRDFKIKPLSTAIAVFKFGEKMAKDNGLTKAQRTRLKTLVTLLDSDVPRSHIIVATLIVQHWCEDHNAFQSQLIVRAER